MSPDERTFFRIDASPPTPDTRDTSAWRFLAGSGEWLLAATERRVAVRHADAPRWNTLPTALKPRSPELDPIRIFSVCPDAEGGFWIGSDAGLGFLHAETGTSQFRTAAARSRFLAASESPSRPACNPPWPQSRQPENG